MTGANSGMDHAEKEKVFETILSENRVRLCAVARNLVRDDGWQDLE